MYRISLSFSFQGDPQGWLEVKKPGKIGQFMGLALLGFPSLLGIYAMVYLYVTNISFWTSESYFLVILSLITVGYDLYFVSFWNTSFWWHQNHVFAHCTFLISEYAACGYLAFKVELDNIGFESLLTFFLWLCNLLCMPYVYSRPYIYSF